jgi:hypothetical protein
MLYCPAQSSPGITAPSAFSCVWQKWGQNPAAEPRFAVAMSPIEALRAWMLLFVDYIATKQIIASALNAYVGGPSRLYVPGCP